MDNSAPASALTRGNARERFEQAAETYAPRPQFEGQGILITAGGPFVPSAFVVVRLLRRFGVTLPVEIWHAGADEIPDWGRRAFKCCNVMLRDVMDFCPDRPLSEMRGWPIKPAALLHSKLRDVLFLDADCFPLRNPEFLFKTREFQDTRSLFWPDNKFHKMGSNGSIWELTGLPFQGDTEFETGIFLVDKEACWRELCLAQWLNLNSSFWYDHVLGDKDTFYLAWRKLGRHYFLAPPCKRYRAVITRHHWIDGAPIADHRTGASKYGLPRKKGPFRVHLVPYKWRSGAKNVYDELMQRFLVSEFSLHTRYLDELQEFQQGSRSSISND